ncbi:RNA-binding domain-containing protein [Teratosphaeria nubilosa]|uniref:RNA-binding domain-containing protein n=1 Tax=Teratosphaeria nubilosa TaxID=161662 RepID=A0A6G1L6U4_9PEZI|nr:RNA-binding domain-containing protein [Teratosphaeria nubilosa]
MSDATRQKSTLFVGGLDNQVTEQTLHDAFIPFGEIVDVSLPKPELPSNKDPHRGFAHIEFALAEDAREAIDNMDQSELFGRVIKVNQAKPQKDATEGLGSKKAVWEQEGYAAKYNVGDEDIADAESGGAMDPMQDLEGLAEAGPRQQ